MEEKRVNRRVRYTKMVLRETLIELLKTKPINRITVTDICQHADLNRGTFYNYYCDAYDLLSQLEDDLYNELQQTITRFAADGISDSLLVELLTTIEKNRDLCHVLFNVNSDQTYLNRLLELTRSYTFKYFCENSAKNLTESQMDLLYTFFSNGAVGVIKRWIKGELDVSIEYIANTILALGVKGAEYFFTEDAPTIIIKVKE